MIAVAALIIGMAVLFGGIYYRLKEKKDPEAGRIYTITAVVGAVMAAGGVMKLVLLGG